MTLFIDVWTHEGFILASDVRLTLNGGQRDYIHKLRWSHQSARVVCAIAISGDYPDICSHFFEIATATKDTLREVAYNFAESWTKRFAGTEDRSAVHLVGFEPIPNTDLVVPQVWYWHNWGPGEGFYTQDRLEVELQSFSMSVPFNNHIPQLIHQTGAALPKTLVDERNLVSDYLNSHGSLSISV